MIHRSAIIAASVAHVLAWAAFLGIVLWPCAYQGVTATPVSPGEAAAAGRETVRLCASFIEVNGMGVLVPLLVPVLLTAIVMLIVIARNEWSLWTTVTLWLMAVSLLGFCVLASLSFGVLYLPAALVAVVAAAVSTPRRLMSR